MKVAIITDVHSGPSGYYNGIRRKLSEYSETALRKFDETLSLSKCSFGVNLGDLIQDESHELDCKRLASCHAAFETSSKEVFHLIGNHDNVNLSLAETLSLLKLKTAYYSVDRDGIHFVMLYTEVVDFETQESTISQSQADWLKADLQTTKLPTIVFSHHSLADQNLTGNPWFEGRPDACLVNNREEIREILIASGKVKAVINGHLHWNKVHLHSSIPFITIQSPIENYRGDDTPAGSWGMLEVLDSGVTLEVLGNDAMRYVG